MPDFKNVRNMSHKAQQLKTQMQRMRGKQFPHILSQEKQGYNTIITEIATDILDALEVKTFIEIIFHVDT
jgi:hypothetical protein